MRIWMASSRHYDQDSFEPACRDRGSTHQFVFAPEPLNRRTARLTQGCEAVCAFVNDELDASTLQQLADQGIRAICLRCAGSNNVDLQAARQLGLRVLNVPGYAPESVAEFTLALLLNLCRHLQQSQLRVRQNNFDLSGLVGVQLHGKTAGVVGTGRIGSATALLLKALGMTVLAHDTHATNPELTSAGVRYVGLTELLQNSQVVTLHCPLLPATHHLINAQTLSQLPKGALLVNTRRGSLLDTSAVIEALKKGHLGGLAIDVYEKEAGLFFTDHSTSIVADDLFERLLTLPNTVVSGHQAFLTDVALMEIAGTTLDNLDQVERGEPSSNDLLR